MSQAPQVYDAIAEMIARMAKQGISKDRDNAQQHYKFRGVDDCMNALAPHLAEVKLCILPRVVDRHVVERQSKGGGTLIYTTLTVEFDLVSAVDGSKHTICMVGEAMDSGDKSANKAMSAAYKYACLQAFSIPTEGDNDADAHTHAVAPRPAVSPALPSRTMPTAGPVAAALDAAPENPSCPKCGGRMFDNRTTKKNPKAPDFKCRDRNCQGVIWPPKDSAAQADAFPACISDDEWLNAIAEGH